MRVFDHIQSLQRLGVNAVCVCGWAGRVSQASSRRCHTHYLKATASEYVGAMQDDGEVKSTACC